MTDDTPLGIVMAFCASLGPNHVLKVHSHMDGWCASLGTYQDENATPEALRYAAIKHWQIARELNAWADRLEAT